MSLETKPEHKTKKPRTDRKVSVQKIQSIVGAIERRISSDGTAETKLTVKELTALGHSSEISRLSSGKRTLPEAIRPTCLKTKVAASGERRERTLSASETQTMIYMTIETRRLNREKGA